MPLYEYHCDDCGREFELIRKFSDPPLEECPHCAGKKVRKLFSSPAIQFKGSGFYITDYAKKDSTSASSSSEPKSDSASNEKDAREKRGDKSDKGDKAEKAEKPDKAEKSDKGEKAGKADTATAKTETAAAVKTPAKKETS